MTLCSISEALRKKKNTKKNPLKKKIILFHMIVMLPSIIQQIGTKLKTSVSLPSEPQLLSPASCTVIACYRAVACKYYSCCMRSLAVSTTSSTVATDPLQNVWMFYKALQHNKLQNKACKGKEDTCTLNFPSKSQLNIRTRTCDSFLHVLEPSVDSDTLPTDLSHTV